MKNYAREKMTRMLRERPHINEVHVIMDVEKHRHRVELSVRGKNLDLFCKEETVDMYASIDRALSKMERQLRRYKERHLRKHKAQHEPPSEVLLEEKAVEQEEPYIADRFAMKPMFLMEALLQMKVERHLFLIFLNAKTEEVNLLYRSGDGNIAHIEPKKIGKPDSRARYQLSIYGEDSIQPGAKIRPLRKGKHYVDWSTPEEALDIMVREGARYRFFLNRSAQNASLVYQRADGNYALIEPR
jgi:putative sigma-54 modulation protein